MRALISSLVVVLGACVPGTSPTDTPAAEPGQARDDDTAGPAIPTTPADALRTASGLRYVRHAGPIAGASPDADDHIVVRFRMVDERGELVAQSSPQGDPATLEMTRLPQGWAEAMLLIAAGDRAQIWIPAALGFADQDTGPTGGLFVEVELLEVLRQAAVATDPLPITAPPPTAIRTTSGLAYVYIVRGTGVATPGVGQQIEAHYTGWTTDGKKFDSSVDRGEPITFKPEQMIEGWSEALRLMVVGDKIRVWIPEALAYKGKPGRPAGMLVFDIELLALR